MKYTIKDIDDAISLGEDLHAFDLLLYKQLEFFKKDIDEEFKTAAAQTLSDTLKPAYDHKLSMLAYKYSTSAVAMGWKDQLEGRWQELEKVYEKYL